MAKITGVVFDKDGTLFDFQATWGAWARKFLMDLSGGSQDMAAALARAIGFDLRTGMFHPDSPVIAGTPSEIAATLLPHLPGANPVSLVSRMNALAAVAHLVETVPLRPLLSLLRGQGLRIGLATNDAEGPARAHLAAAGIADLFDFVAGFDSGYGAKPGPGPLLAFADAFGLNPQEVLMVGDSRHDLIAGRAAGMQTAGVLSGLAAHEDLAPLADLMLDDIGGLPDWIGCRSLAASAS